MKTRKTSINQHLILVSVILLNGCENSLDQTNGDMDAPVGSMTYIAGQMHAQGDDEGAMQFYARAIQQNPQDIQARSKLAELFEAHGGNKDAADQYESLVRMAPENANYWRGYGRVLVRQNQPADAKEKYQRALAIDATDIRTLNGLGVSLDMLNQHAEAQLNYKKALEEKPNDLATINNLGHSYNLAGDYDSAINLLEPQTHNTSAPVTMRQSLAEAYAMVGRTQAAERVLAMDMPAAQARKQMQKYKTERAKVEAAAKKEKLKAATAAAPTAPEAPVAPLALSAEPSPQELSVALGSFTNQEYAQARIDSIKKQFEKQSDGLVMEIVEQHDEAGSAPTFFTRGKGFKNASAAQDYCATLKKGGAFCKVSY